MGINNMTIEEINDAILHYRNRCRELDQHLGNLLAIIHRDGGQYISKYGVEKAVKDAKVILGHLMNVENDHVVK